MRKTFRMFFALALMVMGAMSVNAQRVSLQDVEFYSYDGWGPDAKKLGLATPEWIMNAPSSCPYGDTSVNNGADLSAYSKMFVTVSPDSEGMRIMMNRKIQEGQCDDTEEASNLISIPSHAWCTQKYCKQEGLTYIIDLAQILKDQGFVRLHAIKGASYNTNATIESIELEPAAVVKQVGWTEITTNGNLEGEDMSSFVAKVYPSAEILPAPVVEGAGVDGGKGIMIAAPAKVADPWDSQFWIVLPQPLPEGTKFRVFFDAKANTEVTPETQAHRAPSDYIHYEMLTPNPAITTEWQSFSYEGVISASQAGSGTFQSIAFNLSMDTDVEYYFDNIRFEEYKYGVSATFDVDVIKLDFGFDTNLPDLVKACGKPRLMYPDDCVSVTVNGDEAAVVSVEGFADGRFYVFMEDALNDDDVVKLTFKNPADAAYHLVYNGGPGGDVKDFDGEAAADSEAAAAEDAYSYLYVTPTLIAADPEAGSFNLPNNISEFKATFDKNVDASQIKATLNGEALTIEPAEGMVENFTFKRAGGDLATGAYDLRIFNILPEIDIFEGEMAGDTTLVLSVGKVNLDPSDTVRVMVKDYFAATSANGIPEGYTVYFGQEVREGGSSWGSGSRMFDFGAGGDFTKGLYFREGYVEYGYVEGKDLTLEAGKSYNIHFNTAMWKDNGGYMKFEIRNEADEIVYEQLIQNNPNVNGATNAVFNTTAVDLKFKPEATGKYFLKWWSSNANGDTGTVYAEVLLANVSVKYVPNAAGVEETQLILTALANAKSTRDGNTEAKYAGAAFDALSAAITKYEAEYETYTAPSAYTNAAAALDAAATAMKDHRALCDAYYALPEKAQNILDNNAEKKFAKTDLYIQLSQVAPKYVTKNVTTETNPETGETTEVVTLVVKELTDDAELQTAIDELQALVNTTEKLFTEGESKVAETGIKVLVERFRLAAASLQKLGVPADDELVVAAQNALDDDDDLAEKIKNRMKLEIFGQLKNADNKMFEEKLDTNTYENYTETYDLTVFVKNPNMYADGITYNAANQLQSGWTVPGWVTPADSLGKPDISTGWNAVDFNNVDIMFQTWGAAYCVEQTIVDLPAGVYNVVGGFGERDVQGVTSYFYAKTSETPEGEVGDTITAPIIGQTFPIDNLTIPNVVVTDGMLTIGAMAASGSHTFFNQVKLYLAGAATGYDYANAYEEIAAGVEENLAVPTQVLSVELYDLNGRRILKAQQGIVIVKKFMSDGTIHVEKIIKK